MGSKLYDEIVSQRGFLERLVARIPGFKGYHEKEARRDADTMLREQIASEIEQLVTHFNRAELKILDKHGMVGMAKVREIKSKLQSYADLVRTAAPKYSAMFAQIKVTEADLDKIYAFDEAQFRFVAKLDNALERLDNALSAGEDHQDALEKVLDTAQEAIDAFAMRDDVLLEISQTL